MPMGARPALCLRREVESFYLAARQARAGRILRRMDPAAAIAAAGRRLEAAG